MTSGWPFLPHAANWGERATSDPPSEELVTFMILGKVNPAAKLDATGFPGAGAVHYNYLEPALIEAAVKRGEGVLGQGGTILVETGKHTGRSPQDKFVVDEPLVRDNIWWDNNKSMSPEHF